MVAAMLGVVAVVIAGGLYLAAAGTNDPATTAPEVAATAAPIVGASPPRPLTAGPATAAPVTAAPASVSAATAAPAPATAAGGRHGRHAGAPVVAAGSSPQATPAPVATAAPATSAPRTVPGVYTGPRGDLPDDLH
jgi:hypothetical protein